MLKAEKKPFKKMGLKWFFMTLGILFKFSQNRRIKKRGLLGIKVQS